MIGIELAGGLGNQMFEYAFIFSLHKKLAKRFYLLKAGEPILLYKYFKLDKNLFYSIDNLMFNHAGYRLFFSHYLRSNFYKLLYHKTIYKKIIIDNAEDPEMVMGKFGNKVLYSGYFQSELYFKQYETDIKKLFELKPAYINAFNKKFSWIKEHPSIVTVHIRKTDYTNAFSYLDLGSDDLSIPLSYYHQLIKQIHEECNFYVFISDDIKAVETEFSYLKNSYFSKEDEISDFQLMLNASICIIANSSFSWWAAYLNNKKKVVYCPKNYLGFLKNIEYPNKIYPLDWVQITVS